MRLSLNLIGFAGDRSTEPLHGKGMLPNIVAHNTLVPLPGFSRFRHLKS